MPLFKYVCEDCGEIYEELVSSESERVPCLKCKSENTHRLVSLISSKGLSSGCVSCEPSNCSSKFT
ncbi:MAG: zinc ribbon domain-containing protein [candidate division Zixibacteria bacterium]|jgi:putative FmdB family regulatory protein|nr:zinc ribbon domain-containing protein [candidate division Zixibacteria bacterium]MCK4606499.1 zinc ribbon domain-containing protein [candidate division Zixibacteria bacterium]